jgi:hypothetical protein
MQKVGEEGNADHFLAGFAVADPNGQLVVE